MYVFFTLSLIESWSTFGIYLAVEVVALTIELCHSEASTALAFLRAPGKLMMRFLFRKKGEEDDVARQELGQKPVKKEGTVKLPPSVWELHQNTAKKEGHDQVKELSAELYTRLIHYILAIQARVFGAVAVSLYLPTWYYGPNHLAYIFDFPEHEVPVSILKTWVSVLVALLHFSIAHWYLKRHHGIDMLAMWVRISGKYYESFMMTYLCAPVFPASQMGVEWNTVWFLRRIGGLRMTSVAHGH
ncbi:hypothetical protein HK104_010052 [Borealophlyctis nickersoniae]|nr:hypothetical protein HK104_010052 [Borealophlyctis nickersoniae]